MLLRCSNNFTTIKQNPICNPIVKFFYVSIDIGVINIKTINNLKILNRRNDENLKLTAYSTNFLLITATIQCVSPKWNHVMFKKTDQTRPMANTH